VISGLSHSINEVSAHVGCYTAVIGS